MVKRNEIIDGRGFGYYAPYISRCTFCKHFDSIKYACVAFPNGIPKKYLSGEQAHLMKDKQQVNDIVLSYEKIEDVERRQIPNDEWGLLEYAVMGDIEKLKDISRRINQDGKILVAVYPGVPELIKGIDISEMEFVGSIIDGALYLK